MKQIYYIFLLLSFYGFSQSNYELGKQYFNTRNWEKSIVYFKKSLAENYKKNESIEFIGDAYGQQKDWDNAIENYQILKESFPKNANYWYKYGGALGMKAKESNKFKALSLIDDVENAFLKAASLDKKHIETRWALVMLYIELPAIIGGSEKKAQRYADELMTLSKVDGYLAKGYIDVYFKRYQSAEKNYIMAHKTGNSKTTFEKLYDLYLNKLKNKEKAQQLKNNFEL
ncbi:tetratricopeptide repeat protein [Flavobacterium sp.]|uniref:tetratricopeptide repeat protein n=1 Tax=Flavobacterium sp. TaxID=239 RepID=UPI0035285B2D